MNDCFSDHTAPRDISNIKLTHQLKNMWHFIGWQSCDS